MADGALSLSVVVPSVNGWGDLGRTLAALSRQPSGAVSEVIVVERVGPSVRDRVRSAFPHVRVLPVSADTTIPQMRRAAFAAAGGDVVAVIEDHVIVPSDWAERMLAAHRDGALVVGGAVDNAASDRLVDRAAFLCEYSHCLDPPSGSSRWLTGNNVTYRRDLLERFDHVLADGRWEDHLHDAFLAAGIPLTSRPDIRVGHRKHYTVREYVHQRYHYARAFAGMRTAGRAPLHRLGYGTGAVILPLVLVARIAARALRLAGHRRELLPSFPLLLLFVTAWSAGEFVGYWRGEGDSLCKVC